MKYTISKDTVKVEYKNNEFWQQFDEIVVENPKGWYIRYVEGGIVHSFGYSQSSGRGEYIDEYHEDVYTIPLPFTNDAKVNAKLMHQTKCSYANAMLVREE